MLSQIPHSLVCRADFGADPEIRKLDYDSRQVGCGSLFFAIRGTRTDGHRFLPDAVSRGAAAVMSEQSVPAGFGLPWIQVTSIRKAMATCSDRFFGCPSRSLRLAGITGTNGKTTTAYLVHAIGGLRGPCLMMGTVQTVIGNDALDSKLTTPESVDIHGVLRAAADRGCALGVMEVSSHALAFDRVYGCRFPVAVFTNLTQDHLDFHPDLESYFQSKARLFDPAYNPDVAACIVNGDDPWGKRLLETAPGAISYGLGPDCAIHPRQLESDHRGIRMSAAFFGSQLDLESPMVGRHNVYNLLAAAGAAHGLGLAAPEIQEGIARLSVVPGRFEKVELDLPFTVVIDYAHSPDALENVLRLAREVTRNRLICLFGCGGDRDRAKRPQMGAIAVRAADLVVITSDNPRTEDPAEIVADIELGLPEVRNHVETVIDRRQAIRRALELARPGDLVVLAGKGHETYQEINGQRFPFDEREIVREAACSL